MKETKKKGKPSVTQVTVVITVLIIAMMGYYCYLVNRDPGQR